MDEILTRTIALACPVEHAFGVFTEKIDLWWPRGHRRNRDASLAFEGNALVERAPDGGEWIMGAVTAMQRPHLLALDWFPGSPGAPTAVEVRFAADGDGTVITVTHRAITLETKSIWPQRVARFADGWETVLPALRHFIEET
ncbi:MAG TPA: SRPBCC domain-containing protein [Devosia sp.]|nr:SRPBCC domain-containing protein [Devosia sp.]